MSAGEGASVLVLYQRDKMKELRRTGTIELFTNQGDQQKAGSGDCPKGGNPQPDLFLHKGRQRTDRANAIQKNEQHRQQAKAGGQTFLAGRGTGRNMVMSRTMIKDGSITPSVATAAPKTPPCEEPI